MVKGYMTYFIFVFSFIKRLKLVHEFVAPDILQF